VPLLFWAKAHCQYKHCEPDDPDLKRYAELASQLQGEGYEGVTGLIQDIGHRWVARRTRPGRVLEIGFGAGRHASFYAGRREDYFVSEFAEVHFSSAAWQRVRGQGVRCDARRLPFSGATFDTVISIYNLEHISDLQAVFHEVHRVLNARGRFLIALPCEGGLLWNLGRELTTRRTFQRRYGINYDKIIAQEHVWDYHGVYTELHKSRLFRIDTRRLFPTLIPVVHINLIACFECVKA
jgi:SAM-dependent methyltransferase